MRRIASFVGEARRLPFVPDLASFCTFCLFDRPMVRVPITSYNCSRSVSFGFERSLTSVPITFVGQSYPDFEVGRPGLPRVFTSFHAAFRGCRLCQSRAKRSRVFETRPRSLLGRKTVPIYQRTKLTIPRLLVSVQQNYRLTIFIHAPLPGGDKGVGALFTFGGRPRCHRW